MDISIIILNYKSKGLALNCIKSIKEADWTTSPMPSPSTGEGKLTYEIIVVDNNSQDEIGAILGWQYPDVKFIQNIRNDGLSIGNNLGAKQAQGKYVIFMNPDTLALKDTFTKLFLYMETHPKVGIVGPKQFNPDRTVQDSCYHWHGLLTPIYRRTPLGGYKFAQKDLDRFLMKDYNKEEPREVDWLLGSFLFCRADALRIVGFYDKRFFLYFEDTDLCRKFHKSGYDVVYFPDAQIIHNHNRESARVPWYKFFTNPASLFHIISWAKYLKKWGIK